MIRDEEMWRVVRILNTRNVQRPAVSFVERYRNGFDAGMTPAPVPVTVRSRLRSILR